MAGAALALAAALFFDFWTPEVFLAGHDTFTHDYLMWEWGWQRVLATGRIPLWNPYLFGGWPFVASFAFCPFYPPAWLSAALPTSLAITLQYALHLAVGAMGFYAFARSIRIQPLAAMFVALLYEMGGHVATLAFPGHLAKVQAIAWVGWAMAAAVMLARRGGARWVVGLAAAWAMQLLASHLQIFYATFWLATLYAVPASVFHERGEQRCEARERLRALVRAICGLLAALVLAGCLAAAQMMPAMEMAARSNRGAGVDHQTATFGALPANELAEVVLPSFRGDSTGRLRVGETVLPYIGVWNAPEGAANGERLVSDYMGVWALVFAVIGFLMPRARKKWFFLAAAVAATLVSLGDATPFFRWVYYLVPGFNRFRSPATFMVVTHFSVFALAALGADWTLSRLMQTGISERKKAATVLAIVAVCTAIACRVLWDYAADSVGRFLEQGGTLRGKQLYVQNLLAAVALRHALLFLGGGAGALACAVLSWRVLRRNLTFVCVAAFVVVAAADGFTHVRHFLPRDRTENLEHYLRGHWIEGVILGDAGGATLPTVLEVGHELSNRAMMRGVRSVHGYHPVVFGDYEKLVVAAGGFNSPVLARHFAQNYRVVAADAAVGAGWRVLAERQGRKVIARDEPIPFARVPKRVEPLGRRWDELSAEQWRAAIGGDDFDAASRTICEGNYEWRDAPAGDGGGTAAWAVLSELVNSDELRLRLDPADAARARSFAARKKDPANPADGEDFIPCLLPIPAGPGWRVRIERSGTARESGGLAPGESGWLKAWPRRANGFFLLVPLSGEPGSRTIVSYRPLSLRLGVLVTAATLLTLAAISFLARGRHPRGRKRADARDGEPALGDSALGR